MQKNNLYKAIETYGKVCNFEPEKLPSLISRIKGIANAYFADAKVSASQNLIGRDKDLQIAYNNAINGEATIFGYQVKDPERFGIMELDKTVIEALAIIVLDGIGCLG